MTNKKEEIYERASRILYPRHDRYFFFNESHKRWEYADTHWQDQCKPLSQVYTLYRREQIAAIIRASANVITTQTTNPITAFKEVDNLLLKDFSGKHRDGRMRNNWWIEGIQEYWKYLTTYRIINRLGTRNPPDFPALHNQPLDLTNPTHINALEFASFCSMGLKHENTNLNTITLKTKMVLGWTKWNWSKFNKNKTKSRKQKRHSHYGKNSYNGTHKGKTMNPNQWRQWIGYEGRMPLSQQPDIAVVKKREGALHAIKLRVIVELPVNTCVRDISST